MLTCDGFRKLFKDPEKWSKHLLSFGNVFYSRMQASEVAFSSLISDASYISLTSFESLRVHWDHLKNVMKFLLESLGPTTDSTAEYKAVLWLLQFKASTTDPIMSLQDSVKSNSAWNSICNQCIRTSKTGVKLRPILGRVIDSLKGSTFTAQKLTTLLEEVKELREGLRSQDWRGKTENRKHQKLPDL